MNQTIGINITPQSFQPTLHFSQGDVGRVFVVNVTDYDIPTGATVTCVATKPSGMGFTVSGTVSGNSVTFTSTAEMTDEWGRFPAEIRIASGNTLLGTANFLMIGEKDPHPASTIDGTQEELIPQLTLLVNRVEAAAESVHDLTVSATTLTAGSDATATYDSTNNSIAFGIPRGADGDVTRSEFNDLKSEITGNGVVAGSNGLVSDAKISDSVPYLFRQTADGTRVGNVLYEEIVGGTVAFNQLAIEGTSTDHGITRSAVNGKINLNGTASGTSSIGCIDALNAPNHKVLVMTSNTSHEHIRYFFRDVTNASNIRFVGYNTNIGDFVFSVPSTCTTLAIYSLIDSGTQLANFQFKMQIFDLTQMFGSAIADHLYSLETATAGAGVAVFRKMFPNSYYPYNAGELKSIEGLTSHDCVGFNQWGGELEEGYINLATGAYIADTTNLRSKEKMAIVGGQTYYFGCAKAVSGNNFGYAIYDDSETYISGTVAPANSTVTMPTNAKYFAFFIPKSWYGSTDNHDICINISGSRNGQYEPYVKRTYALDSTLTLRGIPKLSDGKIYYDGDTYDADGTVTRKYGIVDLGTLNWSDIGSYYASSSALPNVKAPDSGGVKVNAIAEKYLIATSNGVSNGTENGLGVRPNGMMYVTNMGSVPSGNICYELATPTTETAEPYTSPQIVDRLGTEEYVTTGIVPIGHNSKYSEDLKGKVESLPWDFSTLIAPTETTNKASRNYTTGSLLIMNNILYKVTANIQSGGTITPNTNCTATTLSEVIASL